RVRLPRLRDFALRHLGRELHAFANSGAKPRPVPLHEFAEALPDLAGLDDPEDLPPWVEAAGSHAAPLRFGQILHHVAESRLQQRCELRVRLLERVLQNDETFYGCGEAGGIGEA